MIEQYLKDLKVPKDELTAIERNKLLNEGKDVDRIMCCIDSGETLAPLIGCTLPEYYFSAEKMCELEEYIYNKSTLTEPVCPQPCAAWQKLWDQKSNILITTLPSLRLHAIQVWRSRQIKRINVDEDGRLPIILKGLKWSKKMTWRQSTCERDCHWTIYRCLNACWNRKSSERYGKTTG